MKTILYLGLTLATCRLFAQPPNPAWRHLPPDAAAIYHFNLATLTDKIPWYALAAPIPAPQHNTSNRELVAILKTPDKAGVDVRHDLFIIQSGPTTSSPGADDGETTSFLFQLSDTAKWTAFLRSQDPGLHMIPVGGDTCFAGREKMGVAWNSQYAVLTFVNRLPHPAQPGETRRVAIHRSLAVLRGYDDSAAIHDPLFLSGFASDADIHAWTKHGQLLYSFLNFLLPPDHSLANPRGVTGGPCLHTLSSLRFEKGRITLSSVICLPPGADSIYARLIDHPLSAQVAARLPQTGTLGLCSLHFNPGLLADLLTELQTRGATEELLFDKGLSLESFAHGFQGDFAVIATHSDAARGQIPVTLSFAASTLDPPAARQWTNRLHPSGCTLRDSLLWIGQQPDSTQIPTAPAAATVPVANAQNNQIPAAPAATSGAAAAATPSSTVAPNAQIPIASPGTTAPVTTAPNAQVPATTPGLVQPPIVPRATPSRATQSPDSPHLSRFLDPSAPISGYLDCKALAQYWKGLQILSVMDKLTFTAGRLNANGQIENTFQLTLSDPRAYSLQTLWPLLGP